MPLLLTVFFLYAISVVLRRGNPAVELALLFVVGLIGLAILLSY